MRDVLISLKPYYYYLIGENIKKVEVRKSYPKAEDWSRNSWFYMSRDEKSFAKIPKEFQEKYRKHFGKVGMRFVCDRIYQYSTTQNCEGVDITDEEMTKASCLTKNEIEDYEFSAEAKENCIYKIGVYGWHITDLVVYDEPRELSEFMLYNVRTYIDEESGLPMPTHEIARPFQSWGYVKAKEPRQTAD